MNYWILFSALLATAMGQSVVITLLPALGRSAGLGELHVALILSTSSIMYTIGSSKWGSVGYRLGRRRTLLMGLTGYTLGTLIFTTVFYAGMIGWLTGFTLFLVLLVSRVGQSSIMSATPPSAMGYAIAHSKPSERLNVISRLTSANSLGQILGPALGGILTIFGLLAPLYTIAAFTLMALILVWKKLPEESRLTNPAPASDTHASALVNVNLFKSGAVHYIATAAFIFCGMAMVHQSLGFFYMDELHRTPVQAGRLVGFAAMTTAIVSLLTQFFIIRRGISNYRATLTLGLVLLIAAFLQLSLNHSFVGIYLAMATLGCGMGLSYPSVTAAATSIGSDKQQASLTGIMTATPAIGFIVGPTLGAVLYKLDSFYPFYAGVVIMVGLFLLNLSTGSESSSMDNSKRHS